MGILGKTSGGSGIGGSVTISGGISSNESAGALELRGGDSMVSGTTGGSLGGWSCIGWRHWRVH